MKKNVFLAAVIMSLPLFVNAQSEKFGGENCKSFSK